MKETPDKSIDMILCDLPYGTTACSWDIVIPFEPLWKQYKRIIKDNGAIVLFGSEPFSSCLRMSNIKSYKYDWKWVKSHARGFLNAYKQPLRKIEDITVFYNKQCLYNPQTFSKNPLDVRPPTKNKQSECYGKFNEIKRTSDINISVPDNILKFNICQEGLHPTQKPVALFKYLIKTYTNENDTVLDNCSGSGTTAIACLELNRNFICIEKDPKYHALSVKRVEDYKSQMKMEFKTAI